jgi:hypothetical protein
VPYNPGSPGIGNVGSYQVSGKPFVSGGIDLSSQPDATPLVIKFPSVTRWIIIRNRGNSNNNAKVIQVAGSANGFTTGEYFRVSDDYNGTGARRNSTTPRLELKMTEIYLTGSSDKVDVIAGLTGISTNTIPDNWSGSVGIG